jgi:S1-C subfamily serine protease
MKLKTLFTTLLLIGITVRLMAGTFPQDPRSIPVFVQLPGSTGSGFFICTTNGLYLVTAKHVLFNPADGTNAPTLKADAVTLKSFYVESPTNTDITVIDLNLKGLMTNHCVFCSSSSDVAAVKFETPAGTQFIYGPFVSLKSVCTAVTMNNEDNIEKIHQVAVGDQVFMFGYPTSLTAPIAAIVDPTEPLLRGGIVAGKNEAKDNIIIDCPAYFGNSGGPVILVDRSDFSVTKFRIIGVVSKFIPFQEIWENKTMQYMHVTESNSGYTVIVPIDDVMDMIKKHE